MAGLVPGLDESVEGLMKTVRLYSQSELDSWLASLVAACPVDEPDRSIADFTTALSADASAWPTGSTDSFLLELAALADGVRPAGRLLLTLQQDPGIYWTLQALLYPVAPVATTPTDRFGWLAEQQVRRLTEGWGDGWRGYLGEQLDYRWGAGWEATYGTEGSQGYLDQLIDEWLPQEPVAQPEPQQPIAQQPEPQEAQLSPEELDQLIAEAIQDNIKTVPGADELTDEELAEVAAELRAELSESEL
jgi:hypothetical protein